MSGVNFADANSGPFAAGIGWFDFVGVTLPANSNLTVTNTLPNGGSMTFTLNNTNSNNISFSGHVSPQRAGIPFGTTNYTGIAGYPLIDASQFVFGLATLSIDNITVTNADGATIPFGLVVAEAEGSIAGESWTWSTNGTPWKLIANIYGSLANINGIGTTTVTWGGANPWPSPVVSTNNPVSISGITIENFASAIALGIILTPITFKKDVVNRITPSDQFDLSIIGPQTGTTITSGLSTGLQSNYASVYSDNGETYIINEAMAAGSSSNLNQYITTVTIVNTSVGGTTIPANWKLGDPLTVQMGDNISVIATNTPINPTITSLKTVDKFFAGTGDLLNYTIFLTNTSPNLATNTTFIDTIPNGSTLVLNSLTVNGIPVSGSPNPPGGLNLLTLPGNSVTTINYQVLTNTIPPIITPLKNQATTNYSYLVVSNTIPALSTITNVVTTTISSAILTSAKEVNLNNASIGDILTYTIPINNQGNTTAYNLLLFDEVPNNTTFIPNSLTQDGVVIPGGLNPAGTSLPNPVNPLFTSTITFKVLIDTIPSPNPIPNTSITTYNYLVDNTTVPTIIGFGSSTSNTVNTFVEAAVLDSTAKYIDKVYSTCGDTLTYTIVIPNTGNATATNITFIDTIPNGTTFISNSVTINGVVQPGLNPSSGISLPNIVPNSITTISFQVKIQC